MDIIPFSLTGLCLENYFIKITTRSKIIYWIIIVIVLSGIAILPFVYVDVSVQARGYFQSEIEKQVVFTPFQGKVIYSSISNGDKVAKGDTLLVIDSEGIRAQQSALIQQITENDASIDDLISLTETDSFEKQLVNTGLATQRYRAELANLRNQYSIQYQKYQKKKSEHERNELLYKQKLIPDIDYENSLFMLSSEKDNLQHILIYQKSIWQNDLALRRIDSVKLLADLEQYTEGLTNRIVLAPTSGEIIQSSDIQAGSIVNPGQKIAEISPDGELVATCFDFRIKCKPDKTYLSLRNGHKAYIKKGMSINTRIVVIQRSLFNLLFDKADKWFNPYTYKKE